MLAVTAAAAGSGEANAKRSEEHTSELQSRQYLVCRLLLEKKKKIVPRQPVSSSQVRIRPTHPRPAPRPAVLIAAAHLSRRLLALRRIPSSASPARRAVSG